MYRPRQPNWEYTMWKIQDFSATQILREINQSNTIQNSFIALVLSIQAVSEY